jgi:hypothetical protein
MNSHQDPRLGDAVNQAARDLPKGWQLVLVIENGAAEVVLFRPSGVEETLPSSDEPLLSERVRAAVEIAKKKTNS